MDGRAEGGLRMGLSLFCTGEWVCGDDAWGGSC